MTIAAILDLNSCQQNVVQENQYRKFRDIDMDALRSDLLGSDLISSPCSSLSDLCGQYHNTLSLLLDKHAPLCRKRCKHSPAVWVSAQIIEAKHLKCKYECIWRCTQSSSALSALHKSRFRRQVNHYNNLVSKAKSDRYSDMINANSHKKKDLWKALNSILHRNKLSIPPDTSSLKDLANR